MTSDLCHRIEGGEYFSFLFNKTTDPSEVFGPFSLAAMERDQFKRKTKGYLPEAHIAYLDEVWKANSPILNLLLPILNEREFVNDGKKVQVPLMTAFASSNEFPEDREALSAIYDRFVLRMYIDPLKDNENVEKMLMDRITRNNQSSAKLQYTTITIAEIEALNAASKQITMNKTVLKNLVKIQNIISKKAGSIISDRKKNQCIDIVQAYALLEGRGHVTVDDLLILRHVFFDEGVPMEVVDEEILKLVDPYTDEVNRYYKQFLELKTNIDSITDPSERIKSIVEFHRTVNKITTDMGNAIAKAQSNGKDVTAYVQKIDEISKYASDLTASILNANSMGAYHPNTTTTTSAGTTSQGTTSAGTTSQGTTSATLSF